MKSQLSFAFAEYRLIGILLFVISFGFHVHAQEYPVQVTTILTPPYTPYLSNYASPDRDALQLIILLRELDRPQYNVKLRFTIEGQGIRIRTKATYQPRPITIQGGVPSMLGAADFNSYFHPDNLEFSGITKEKFLRTTALPDGYYTFTAEVLDYTRGVVVSNAGTANAWIMLNDPPLINLPANHQKITASDPQNIFFSWTPLHLGSPNSAFATEYVFTLVELYPSDRNPNDAMATTNFIFTHITSSTSLNYGMAEPLLIPGRKYAFRVQARDVTGQDLFKNNGNSEVFVFQYGDACVALTKVKTEPLDENRIRVSWEENEVHSGYTIRYRKKGASNWFEERERSTSKIITGLEPGSKYEFQVMARCQTLYSDGTAIELAETPTVSENKFACGSGSEISPPSTIPLQQPLLPGDLIRTADFTIKITEVTKNPGGSYKGKGTTAIPLFNNATINVKFRDILVNYQYIVYSGTVSTVYSSDSRGIIRVNEDPDNSPIPTSDAPDIFAGVDIPFNGDVNGVAIDTVSGKIVLTLADGSVSTIDRPKDENGNFVDTRITDKNGDVWVVDKNGNVSQGASTAPPVVASKKDDLKFQVQFKPGSGQFFGFDKKEDALGTYRMTQIHGQDYSVSWKAIESGKQDYVDASADGKSEFPSTVAFKFPRGAVASRPSFEATSKTLTVLGGKAGDVETVTAYALLEEEGDTIPKEITLGELNVVTYDWISQHVYIVPVNGATLPELAQAETIINKVFNQAVAGWRVTIDHPFEIDPSFIHDLDAEESGTFASYNSKMRDFNREFRNSRAIDKNGFYIFLINGSNSSRKGFMPIKRGYGYIFPDKGATLHTIAHELGHGAFNLRHTFSEFPTVSEGSTDNLMDYKGGTELKKYQWDHVHDPERLIGWLMEDEESATKSLHSSKYVFMHNQLSTKSYASNIGVNEFTQEAISHVDSKLYQLDTAGIKTYIYFSYIWFHAGNIDRFDQLIDNSFKHAIDSVKAHLNEKDFNLLAIVNAKYDTALANGLKTVSFREKFYKMNGLSSDCLKAINSYLNSPSKKTFVNGLSDALKQRADKLLEKLKNCKIVLPEEIVIHYKRKGRNEYRTWGEFSIVGTDYKGYILERPKGDNPTKLEDCKRHPAGTYDIVYSTSATGTEEKFWNVTMCLKEHTAYKLHGGTRADNSDGCLLINYNSPEFDKYPEAFQAKEEDVCIRPASKRDSNPDKNKHAIANTYYQHDDENNPAYKLKKYIETMEAEIKKKHKVEQVVKKIIIDEKEEKEEL